MPNNHLHTLHQARIQFHIGLNNILYALKLWRRRNGEKRNINTPVCKIITDNAVMGAFIQRLLFIMGGGGCPTNICANSCLLISVTAFIVAVIYCVCTIGYTLCTQFHTISSVSLMPEHASRALLHDSIHAAHVAIVGANSLLSIIVFLINRVCQCFLNNRWFKCGCGSLNSFFFYCFIFGFAILYKLLS